MAQLTREEILARKVGHDVVPLLDGSGTVKIRGLSRNEGIAIAQADDLEEKDNLMISFGLVDPAMTLDDVRAWGAADDAGTLSDLSERIAHLSRMTKTSAKEVTKSTPRRRR